MILSELFQPLNEAMSITSIAQPLKSSIKEAILQLKYYIPSREHEIPEDIKQKTLSEVTLKYLVAWLRPNITINVSSAICQAVVLEVKHKLHMKMDIKFIGMDNVEGGYANGNSVRISDVFLNQLVEKVFEYIYSRTLDRLSSKDELITQFFDSWKRLTDDIFDYWMNKLLDQMVDKILIHEIAHVYQHTMQFRKGRFTTAYKSYLTKDPTRFVEAIKRVIDMTYTDEDFRLYKSSPQEIGAISQDTAAEIIQVMDAYDFQTEEDVNQMEKHCFECISQYLNKQFNNKANKTEYNVYKRYGKLIYQELNRYFDNERLKLNKKGP
jgi:hypothetical protein